MTKKIIICCDGTGNQLGETYSNVVKIYSVIKKDQHSQLAYYDPGVGTLSYPNTILPFWRRVKKGIALALGLGLEENVSQAYSFLMENYQEGDEVFLFGFSRGAYTVRVLAGLIKEIGLLQKGNQHLIPYAWDLFRVSFKPTEKAIAAQFKSYFSRDVRINFMGVWDTVSSIGLLVGYKTYPNTFTNNYVSIVRHAMAIDEKRRFYRQNLFQKTEDFQDVKQVWFAGAHSDVGGSYPLSESGLAQVSLLWMIREARAIGKLDFDDAAIAEAVPEKDGIHSAASYRGHLHNSMSFGWKILEIGWRKDRELNKKVFRWGHPRKLFLDPRNNRIVPKVHISVKQRLDDKTLGYAPKNLLGPPERPFEIEY